MPDRMRAGDVLADRYRLTDLLTESRGGRFWRAFDTVLQRDVAVHVISCDDERAPLLRAAARTSATVLDRRMLRVLDIDEADERCFVVNEWGSGTSLDLLLADDGHLSPTVAAWIVAEVADTLALAHEAGVAHGRLVPENILIDTDGSVRLIGFAVDAALHGLPPGRISADVADLLGLLYAAMTGTWAGVSRSAVRAAPSSHGHVLRPRQVRAGIPRTLDSLCDHVLNHGGDTEVSAAMLADSLRDFLGSSAAAAEAWLGRIEHAQRGDGTVRLPPLPDPPPRLQTGDTPDETSGDTSGTTSGGTSDDSAGDAADDPEGDALPASEPGPGEGEVDVAGPGSDGAGSGDARATEAGLPIFHDDSDDVTWLRHHTEKPPPPPALEPPPVRPLFAPDPEDGEPVRRPRAVPATTQAGTGSYWPWEGTSAEATTGSGHLPVYVDEEPEPPRRAPGTSMLRLAAIIAACLLVLVACVIAFNLGRGRTPLGTSRGHSSEGPGPTSASGRPTASVLTGVTARDFDPQGSGGENAAQAPLAVDHNPATAWTTLRYDQQFGPHGLKTGVGLVLDLHASRQVASVDLTTVGTPTSVSIYVLPTDPSDLVGRTPAGRTRVVGTHGTVTLARPTTGRYVVVWLTRLPAVGGGGFRGGVAEAVVRGG